MSTFSVWYVNIDDAKLAQLMRRSEHVEELKKEMETPRMGFGAIANLRVQNESILVFVNDGK